jgi:hypothetical protein
MDPEVAFIMTNLAQVRQAPVIDTLVLAAMLP